MTKEKLDDAWTIYEEIVADVVGKYCGEDMKQDPISVMFGLAMACRHFLEARAQMAAAGDVTVEEFEAEKNLCIVLLANGRGAGRAPELVPLSPNETKH